MSLVLLRIDDRLIHGQIVTTWMKEVKSNVIIIANDALSKDEFTKKMITLAAPPYTKVVVNDLKRTAEEMKNGKYDNYRVLMLVKTVEDVVVLYENGLEFNELNVGGMGAKANTKVIYRNISATDRQMQLLEDLKKKKVKIEFKIVPCEKGMIL